MSENEHKIKLEQNTNYSGIHISYDSSDNTILVQLDREAWKIIIDERGMCAHIFKKSGA